MKQEPVIFPVNSSTTPLTPSTTGTATANEGVNGVLTKVPTVIESVKRNHSFSPYVLSPLNGSIDPQKSPRIGVVPPHRLPGGAQLEEIESMAETLAAQSHAWWDAHVSPPRSGRGIRRAGALFECCGYVWIWNIVERRAPIGATLVVVGPINQWPLPLVVRKAWRMHHAAA